MDLKETVAVLRRSPIFAGWGRADLARLVPHLATREIEPGRLLCLRGEVADCLFILVEGSARLRPDSVGDAGTDGANLTANSKHDCVGQEAAFGAATYLYNIEATEAVVALAIPVGPLRASAPPEWLQKGIPHLSLIDRQAGGRLEIAISDPTLQTRMMQLPRSPSRLATAFKALGGVLQTERAWLLALTLPTLVLLFLGPRPAWLPVWVPEWLTPAIGEPLNWSQLHFTAILTATLVMWVFHLVPVYIGALFGLLASLVLGVAPANTVLSGFSSSSFFMAMSILGFAFLLKESGLPYRAALYLLRRGSGKPRWANLGMMGTGLLLTPVIPSTTVRTLLMSPLLSDMSEALGQKRGGRAATRLALSMFAGATFFYPLFITSSSLNFILYGLLPEQLQHEFHWMRWLLAAAPTGLILVVLCVVGAAIWFRGSAPQRPPAMDRLEEQIRLLGPLRKSHKEWIALAGLVLLMGAIATSSLHRIGPPWIALGIFYILLSIGLLSESDMKRGIDWSFLIFVGAVVGLVSTTTALGLDAMIADTLSPLLSFTAGSPARMTAVVIGTVLAMRLVLPFSAAGVLSASIFLPLAEHAGHSEWLVVFAVLMMADCWLFPYQSVPLQVLIEQQRDPADGKLSFDLPSFVRFNRWSVLFRVAAIYSAFPYFHAVGIL